MIFRVNTLVPLAAISAAQAHRARRASIVNVTSVDARSPGAGAIACSASKAAQENATIALAKDLGPLRHPVNAVAPAAVEQDHAPRSNELNHRIVDETALKRPATDTKIATEIRFLLSSAVSELAGTVLPVTAGFRL